jgi:hypothetical protein
MQISFEFSEEQIRRLKALQLKTGSSTMNDMFNSAMSMLAWAVDETAKGNSIASVDRDSETYRPLVMPILQKATGQAPITAAQPDTELVLY